AADQMSTFIALQFNENVARTIVRGYAYMAKVWFAFGAPLFSDEHGTGLQRYYNTLCIAGIPHCSRSLLECASEYQQIKRGFEKTVLPFVDRAMMQKVQAMQWLQFNPNQVVSLKQRQQDQQPIFSFAMCNQSKASNISTALMVRLPDDAQKWQVL